MAKLVGYLASALFAAAIPAMANDYQNKLMGMSGGARAGYLEQVVRSAGYICNAEGSEFKGMLEEEDRAFHRVDCTNGVSYLVSIKPDSSTNVMDCRVLTGEADVCFAKW